MLSNYSHVANLKPRTQAQPMMTQADILSASGLSGVDLPPELQVQLNQLLGYQADGKSMLFDRGMESFKKTAPLSIAQQTTMRPFEDAGLSALDKQMALLGLKGNDAMMSAYNENPAHAFAQEQAEKAMIRNRSVTGGLGDEGVQRELAYLTSGLTNQNINNQIQQLALLSGRGQNAAGTRADIIGGQVNASLGMDAQAAERNQARRARDNARDMGMVNTALSLGTAAATGGIPLPKMGGGGGANVVPPSSGSVPSYQFNTSHAVNDYYRL